MGDMRWKVEPDPDLLAVRIEKLIGELGRQREGTLKDKKLIDSLWAEVRMLRRKVAKAVVVLQEEDKDKKHRPVARRGVSGGGTS